MSISRAQVKIELGITDTTYDDQIDAKIPQAEAKYREVAGYNYNWRIYCQYDSAATTFKPSGSDFTFDLSTTQTSPDNPIYLMNYGDIVEGTGIPAGSYITDIDTQDNVVTISDTTTNSSDRLKISYNISAYPTISQIIWFMIGQQTTTAADEKEWASRSVGPLSWTKDASGINKRYNLPEKLVNAIPKYAGLY